MDTETSQQLVMMFVIEETSFVQPVQACSCDYGFDFDEEEVAREMLAPLPIHLSTLVTTDVSTDEFEQVFSCLLL